MNNINKADKKPRYTYKKKKRLQNTTKTVSPYISEQNGRYTIRKSINNKQNSALKSFFSLIDHSDTTIKQKFQVCEDQFMYEMGEAIQRICSACMIPRDTDLAEVYSAYRNKTAHGVISRPEACDVATYRIMRGFICVMNLKRANVPQERIKSIVNKLV